MSSWPNAGLIRLRLWHLVIAQHNYLTLSFERIWSREASFHLFTLRAFLSNAMNDCHSCLKITSTGHYLTQSEFHQDIYLSLLHQFSPCWNLSNQRVLLSRTVTATKWNWNCVNTLYSFSSFMSITMNQLEKCYLCSHFRLTAVNHSCQN